MADEAAKKIYQLILEAMEKKGLNHHRADEELSVCFSLELDNSILPMHFRLRVDEERELIRLIAPLGFHFSENKRTEGALATCYVNNMLSYGCFDYDISDGEVCFRIANPYTDCDIHVDLIVDMIMSSAATLHRYTESFFAISKNKMDIEEFLDGKLF